MLIVERSIFGVCLALVAYVYVGYPIFVWVLSWFVPHEIPREEYLQYISLIIPAHNEERWIRQKLENTLKLDYPQDRLEIIVASDGSTDRTADIAREFAPHKIQVAEFIERHGKQEMLNQLVPRAAGEILVMTDTHVLLETPSVRRLVKHFADPGVGCVTGQRRCILQPGVSQGAGEGLYWRYESWIKKSESRLHSCLGAHGQLYAVRRSIFPKVEKVGEDFYIPMKVIAATGLRVIFEPDAFAYTPAAATLKIEFERKTRAHVSFLLTLPMLPELMVPWRTRVWWQFISHHLLRMFVPVAMLGLAAMSCVLAPASRFFLGVAAAQAVFYAFAAGGFLLALRDIRVKLFYVPFYFTFANLAVACALLRWPRGKYDYAWNRTERIPISS
jgi:cellulose synthase/poly-beta-1,6-N-acetylglucosamine synthase-like glycosyltransferase